VVILGRGLALRTEVAVEVEPDHRGQGLAARVLREARRLARPGEALFAQTAPGNAASLRAFLSAGFRPIGSEVLFFETRRRRFQAVATKPTEQLLGPVTDERSGTAAVGFSRRCAPGARKTQPPRPGPWGQADSP
jgi:GNAT superfamily N-acetyltransferase